MTTKGAIEVTARHRKSQQRAAESSGRRARGGDSLAIQYEKSRPIRSLDGSAFTRMEPRIATQYASAPEYARPFFQYVADVTVQKMTMTVDGAPLDQYVLLTDRLIGSAQGARGRGEERTFNRSIDAAEQCRLADCEAEAGDDDLALVAELHTGHDRHRRVDRRSSQRTSVGTQNRATRALTEFVTFLTWDNQSKHNEGKQGAARASCGGLALTRWQRRRRKATSSGPSDTPRT